MPSLDDIRNAFFSDGPVNRVFTGFPADADVLSGMLRAAPRTIWTSDISDAGLDLTSQRALVVGLHPILIVTFEGVTVGRDLRCVEEIHSFFDGLRRDRIASPYAYRVAFASRDAAVGSLGYLLMRSWTGAYDMSINEDGRDFFVPMRAGERLAVATIAAAPIEGEYVLA
ncbi:hypothetical protein L0Y59_04105 [Candidatus Uhrbacteria bacterium]|nr:hypothetical protein [Candidatus Uhrbacteria bacterium]